jgi:hypothetical protein
MYWRIVVAIAQVVVLPVQGIVLAHALIIVQRAVHSTVKLFVLVEANNSQDLNRVS